LFYIEIILLILIKEGEIMVIAIFSPLDDIKSDGTAIVWWMRGGNELNVKFRCRCIYEMLTTKQLFDIFINDDVVEIEENIFHKYCIEWRWR
jgi:hypothetical protein